jgi:hypothetical protein
MKWHFGPKKSEFLDKFEIFAQKVFHAKKKEVERESLAICQEAMDKLVIACNKQIATGKIITFRDFSNFLFPLLQKFCDDAKGVHTQRVYNQFISSHLFGMLTTIEQGGKLSHQKELRSEEDQRHKLELTKTEEIESARVSCQHLNPS